jgi:tRNA (pseudouridine54-N1)-methyltransferase
MRNFIIVGHRAVTDHRLSLNDLPGTGGRMDIIARSINAAFLLSHDIRKDVEVVAVLLGPENPPKTVRFVGTELKYLNPDERSTGALIRNALIKHSAVSKEVNTNNNKNTSDSNSFNHSLPNEIRSSPGVYISGCSFEEIIKHYSSNSIIVYLSEIAPDISKMAFSNDQDNFTFILSDDKNFIEAEEEIIKKSSKYEISLGPNILHTEQCIILAHNFLDRIKTDD